MTSSSSQLLTNCIYCSTNSYEQCSPPHRPHSPPIHGSPSSSYYQYPPFYNNISPEFHYQHYYPIPPESSLYPPSPPYSPPYYGLQQTGINQKNRNKTQIRNVYGQYDFNVGDGAGNRMIEMTNGWMGYNRESEYNAKKGGGGLGESLEGTVNALEGYEFLYETGNNAKAAIERFTLRPRSPWTQQEDRRLRELYNLLGPRWSKIATQLGTLRCGKQCEERYNYHLRPNIVKEPLSKLEKLAICRLHGIYGPEWARIAKRLRGRTGLTVKNYWYNELKRKKRLAANIRTQMSLQRLLN